MTLDERALLEEAVARQAAYLSPFLATLGATPLTVEIRELLRGALASELLETGLDTEHEHNERGRRIEGVIDALGHL